MNILVSSCLLGIPARYNGEEIVDTNVLALLKKHTLIPVCPEQLGGLPIPREPAEISSSKVMTKSGEDVTDAYQKGAEATLKIAKMYGCTHAIMQKRSPSCGVGLIYDGSFQGKRIEGNGVTAQRLIDAGIVILDENDIKGESMSHEIDETVSVMHMLFAELLKQCAAVEDGKLEPKDFNESVVAAAEAVIAVKRARIARMRQEMGEDPGEV